MTQSASRRWALALMLTVMAVPPAWTAEPKGTAKPTGALAYHRESGSFGYAVNAKDSHTARVTALKQCGHPRCEVVASLSKDCGAVANGPKKFSAARGATRQEAETKALRQCGERCEVVGWACPR
jgi:hypothetical protein